MAGTSKIEWTDATWNPVTGCTKISPGCDHCYASDSRSGSATWQASLCSGIRPSPARGSAGPAATMGQAASRLREFDE